MATANCPDQITLHPPSHTTSICPYTGAGCAWKPLWASEGLHTGIWGSLL